jgi:hypothetical protein
MGIPPPHPYPSPLARRSSRVACRPVITPYSLVLELGLPGELLSSIGPDLSCLTAIFIQLPTGCGCHSVPVYSVSCGVSKDGFGVGKYSKISLPLVTQAGGRFLDNYQTFIPEKLVKNLIFVRKSLEMMIFSTKFLPAHTKVGII